MNVQINQEGRTVAQVLGVAEDRKEAMLSVITQVMNEAKEKKELPSLQTVFDALMNGCETDGERIIAASSFVEYIKVTAKVAQFKEILKEIVLARQD